MYIFSLIYILIFDISEGTRNKSEMRFDPVFSLQIDWSCIKIRFHYSKALFDLPSAFVDSDDLRYITFHICAYRIETIIHCFFIYSLLIDFVDFFFCYFSIRCDGSPLCKSAWIIRIFSILLIFPFLLIMFFALSICPCLIFSISFIFWRIGNDKSFRYLFRFYRYFFIIDGFIYLWVIFIKIFQINECAASYFSILFRI